METVTRFESDLLKLLYFFLGREPREVALPRLQQRCQPPACLHDSALRLVRDALAKGCVAELARRGGWRIERFQRGDGVALGRLWERTPPGELGLTFSPATLDFLIWITAYPIQDEAYAWQPNESALSLGDGLLLYFALEKLRELPADLGVAEWRRRRPLSRHALARLGFPADFAGTQEDQPLDFLPWTIGAGPAILEALQPELADRWVEVESLKCRIADPGQMLSLGTAQELVLSAYLDALEETERWDLARFLLQALARLLLPEAGAEFWVGSLELGNLAMAERTAVYQAALGFVRQLDRLQRWTRQALSVGYFDEGYQAAQLWKSDWERHDGDALGARAAALRRSLEPLA